MTTNRAAAQYFLSGLLLVLITALSASAAASEPSTDDTDPVENAEQALAAADFQDLVPILESTVESGDGDRPGRAHLLYALGLIYEARADGADDGDLNDRADRHIEEALSHNPDIEVDPMDYPPAFVTRVEKLRASSASATASASQAPQIFYFERRVESRSRLPLFLPGGVGQFYNGATFRGVTFATIQAAGLVTNALGYWMVESLRTSSGQIDSPDIGRARGWRRAQYAGIAVFVSGWILSSIEAHLDFEAETVRVRSLDGPPEELEMFPDAALGPDLSVVLQWQKAF